MLVAWIILWLWLGISSDGRPKVGFRRAVPNIFRYLRTSRLSDGGDDIGLNEESCVVFD